MVAMATKDADPMAKAASWWSSLHASTPFSLVSQSLLQHSSAVPAAMRSLTSSKAS